MLGALIFHVKSHHQFRPSIPDKSVVLDILAVCGNDIALIILFLSVKDIPN